MTPEKIQNEAEKKYPIYVGYKRMDKDVRKDIHTYHVACQQAFVSGANFLLPGYEKMKEALTIIMKSNYNGASYIAQNTLNEIENG